MIWDFTSHDLAAALTDAAERESVRIITDDYNYSLPTSVFDYLASEKIKRNLSNLEIITDASCNQEIENDFQENNLNSFLHHHLLLIDDQIAAFGTNNWSGNGFYYNDESVIITNIGSLVKPFRDVWDFNYRLDK